MYRTIGYAPFVVVMCSTILFAKNPRDESVLKARYLPATVLHVQEQQAQSNYVGGSPTDAPLEAEVHTYNVSIQLNCGTYVGRYRSPVEYLPEILRSNSSVDVRLEKHLMHVKVRGEKEYTMAIVQHPRGNHGCEQH